MQRPRPPPQVVEEITKVTAKHKKLSAAKPLAKGLKTALQPKLGALGRQLFLNVVDGIADGQDVLGRVIGDFDIEFFFESHN